QNGPHKRKAKQSCGRTAVFNDAAVRVVKPPEPRTAAVDKDPYQPPSSNVDSGGNGTPGRRSIGWKLYFFFVTVLSGFSFLGLFSAAGHGIVEYLVVVLWVPATAGLFGFAFVRPILFPDFWRYFVVAYLIFGVAYYWLTGIDLREGLTDTVYYVSNAIGWALSLPGYIALYLYGQPTDLAWRGRAPSPDA
ncbi:MAG: hypothetical protein AAFU65_14525, partial [Pseudomonadota bacterium]